MLYVSVWGMPKPGNSGKIIITILVAVALEKNLHENPLVFQWGRAQVILKSRI